MILLNTHHETSTFYNEAVAASAEISHYNNVLDITSKNIQRLHDISRLASLPPGTQVMCLQETREDTHRRSADYLNYFKSQSMEFASNGLGSQCGIGIRISSHYDIMAKNCLLTQIKTNEPAYGSRVSDVLIKLTATNEYVLIINVYAPCSDTSICTRQGLLSVISRTTTTTYAAYRDTYRIAQNRLHTILVGDFNCVTDPVLDTLEGAQRNEACNEFEQIEFELLQNQFKVTDVFRCLAPTRAWATNHHPVRSRRLDRFYISKKLMLRLRYYRQYAAKPRDPSCKAGLPPHMTPYVSRSCFATIQRLKSENPALSFRIVCFASRR